MSMFSLSSELPLNASDAKRRTLESTLNGCMRTKVLSWFLSRSVVMMLPAKKQVSTFEQSRDYCSFNGLITNESNFLLPQDCYARKRSSEANDLCTQLLSLGSINLFSLRNRELNAAVVDGEQWRRNCMDGAPMKRNKAKHEK